MQVDVVLIHPPVNFDLTRRPIQASGQVGYGMLYIAACLAKRGYKVAVWNLEAFRREVSPQDIQKGIQVWDPSIIGIELNWVGFSKGAIQTAKLLKDVRPDIPIIIGGTHATLLAEEIVQKHYPLVDAVLRGEAEKTFPAIVENFEKRGTLGDVGGLVTIKNGHLDEVPLKETDIYTNIDDIPPYTYKVVKHVVSGISVMFPLPMAINTCRGPCKFNCAYCIGRHIAPLSGRSSYSVHSPKWIIEQIKILMEEGSKEIAFQDYFFMSGEKRLLNIAKAIQKEKINESLMGINMTAIPGFLNANTLKELSRTGVTTIDYGAESGSNKVLNILNRPVTKENILASVKATVSEGIIPFTWWMTGLPGERPQDLSETLDLINKTTELGAIPRWITPLVVLPHTDLFKRPQDFGLKLRLKSFEDFSVYSDLEEKAVSWYPEAISHETEYLSRDDILRATFNLKLEIFRRRDELVKKFMDKYASVIISHHPYFTVESLENLAKEVLGYLLKTFF